MHAACHFQFSKTEFSQFSGVNIRKPGKPSISEIHLTLQAPAPRRVNRSEEALHMGILFSGSTGFLGTAPIEVLERERCAIVRVVRPVTGQRETSGAPAKTLQWNSVGGHPLRR